MNRFDTLSAPEWMISKFDTTEEGFLKGIASVTNIGVFPYLKADGSWEWELRHPDDVFAQESLDSLKMKPITNDHPTELVTPENIDKYQVGNIGNDIRSWDGIHVAVDMVIQKKDAIDAIVLGKRGFSCGYTCDLVDESGTYLGIPYTKRQTNIRYNHLSLVNEGRAGEDARIKLDTTDALRMDSADPRLHKQDATDGVAENKTLEEQTDMKTISIDSVDYQADEAVLNVLNTAKSDLTAKENELASIKADKATLEATRDSLTAKLDEVQKELEALKVKQLDESAINAKVQARIALLDSAREADVEVNADASELDIKKAVIGKVFAKVALDGKEDVYIHAMYDCAIAELTQKKADDANASNREVGAGQTAPATVNKADEAYKNMIARYKGAKEAK